MESDAVLALLLAPNGTIRARNHAAYLVLPPDPAKEGGDYIWDYLVCPDVEALRRRLSDPGSQLGGRLLLNLNDEHRNPVTLEARMIRCSGAVLLLGVQERRHDSQFQNEIFKLTNDLALAMRESSRKNRELAEAYKTIELLARTDGLTGLANRRTLDETIQREVARAERMEGRLRGIDRHGSADTSSRGAILSPGPPRSGAAWNATPDNEPAGHKNKGSSAARRTNCSSWVKTVAPA